MSKLNLLEVCLSPSLGGLELYMMYAAKALDKDFNVLSLVAEGRQLEPYFKDTSYTYISIKHKGDSSFSSARKLAKIIDQNKIDIIHIHWTSDLLTTVMALLMSKNKPKLVQSRHMNMTRFKDDIYHRYLYKKMDMILTVTAQLAEQVRKYIPESIRPKVQTLYIGSQDVEVLDIDTIQAYKKEIGVTDEFVIGMVGRIEEAKGQYLLIEAVEKLKAEGKKVKVFFVGHVMQEEHLTTLKKLIKEKELEKEIVFLGFSKEVHRFMQACDVMVLATRCETFGLVLIEAMQVGTPVIASNKCGPLEIIDDAKSGLLFEMGQSSDLYEKIAYTIENQDDLEAMAAEGQRRAETLFSSKKQFEKLSELLKGVVE